jgi:hypothetical protein
MDSIYLVGTVKASGGECRDRLKARDCLLTNLLVLPGMGSVMAGRRVGYAQGFLAIAGMILSLIFAVDVIRDWWTMGELVLPTGRSLLMGGLGVLLFVLGWAWGLSTGLALLKDVKRI